MKISIKIYGGVARGIKNENHAKNETYLRFQ